MKNSLRWILFIFLITALQVLCQSSAGTDSPDSRKQPLRVVLEKIRTESGLNFVYGDNSVGNISINSGFALNPTKENIKKFLKQYNLACRYFGQKNAVIYFKKDTAKKNYGSIVIKNIFENDSADIVEPKIISGDAPVYPRMAVISKIEGTVRIKLLITKEGDVFKTVLQKSSGSALLDSATVEYARKLKFIPAQIKGTPLNIWFSMIFEYYIKNKYLIE